MVKKIKKGLIFAKKSIAQICKPVCRAKCLAFGFQFPAKNSKIRIELKCHEF